MQARGQRSLSGADPDSQRSSPRLFIANPTGAIKGTSSRRPSSGLVSCTQKARPKSSPPECNMSPSLTRVGWINNHIALSADGPAQGY